jgi:hypothetical protein
MYEESFSLRKCGNVYSQEFEEIVPLYVIVQINLFNHLILYYKLKVKLLYCSPQRNITI